MAEAIVEDERADQFPAYLAPSSTPAPSSRYHVEAGTPQVQALLATPSMESFISRLAAVEILSGFAGKVRTGTLSSADFGILRRRFFADVRLEDGPATPRPGLPHYLRAATSSASTR